MTAAEMESLFRLKFDGLYEFTAPDISQEMIGSILTDAQSRVILRKYNPNQESPGFESSEAIRRDLEQLLRHGKIDLLNQSYRFSGSVSIGSKTITVDDYPSSVILGDKIYANSAIFDDGEAIVTDLVDSSTFKVDRAAKATSTTFNITTHFYPDSNEDIHPNGIPVRLPSNFMFAAEEATLLYQIVGGGNVVHSRESIVRPVTHDEYTININNPYAKPYKDLIWRMDTNGKSLNVNNKRTELILPSGYSLKYYRLVFVCQPPAIVCGDSPVDCILNENIQREIVAEAVVIASAALKQENYQINTNEVNRS